MAYLNDLQSKRKTKGDQGEGLLCHAMLLVHCMTAHVTIAIMHMTLKAEKKCQKTLGWSSIVLKLK